MTDEQSYWILSFETLAFDLIQTIKKPSQETNVAKIKELIKKIRRLLRVMIVEEIHGRK